MADFLRAQAGDSPALLAAASSERISHGGSKELAAFMESIVATPDERSAIVSEALKRRIVGGLELGTSPRQAREWILELAPHDADRLTGIALGQLAGWHDFAGMAELALRYRDESGTDEVLVAFLANAPPGSREEILALAGEIGDPAERDGILRRFSGAPGRAEPPADDGF